MTKRIIVSDATPIIALEKVSGGFSFIQKLFDTILVPKQVLEEVAFYEPSIESYLKKHNITGLLQELNPHTLPEISGLDALDDGEMYAIALAFEKQLPLLIHERKGRAVAQEAGLSITGIAGQLLQSYKSGIINQFEALQILQQLKSTHQINGTIYKKIASFIK